ncbi:MAG TPA: glutaredoxin 3 [Sphingomicrobium sp.]|nr:glutaredoxin 3 [Sphingomicrobium sp.]
MALVEIYTKTFCGYCWRARDLFEAKGVEFQEYVIDGGGPKREEMIQRTNGRTTVPQIFIDGRHIGGCTDLLALEHDGKLGELLA